MAISVGFRSIRSGAVANGGEDIVLHAEADDGEANLLLPAEEAPRLAILLLQLMQAAREARSQNAPVDIPALEGETLTVAADPSPNREILEVQLASDVTAPGSKAAVLRLSLPAGSLRNFARAILHSADDASTDTGNPAR